MTHLSAVVWNVTPNVRADAILDKQAKIVNKLADDIWNNVIIVCKQVKDVAQGEIVHLSNKWENCCKTSGMIFVWCRWRRREWHNGGWQIFR